MLRPKISKASPDYSESSGNNILAFRGAPRFRRGAKLAGIEELAAAWHRPVLK